MVDIAKHIRIFNPNPDDDFVTKRKAIISAIELVIKKKTSIDDILKLSDELIKFTLKPEEPSPFFIALTESSFKKHSTSFVSEDEQIQILTCSILAYLQFLGKYRVIANKVSSEILFALVLKSGLSFQTPIGNHEKLEFLRTELINICDQIIIKSGIELRKRINIPKISDTSSTDEYVIVMEALANNAILDREEIDVLWWSLSDWSNLCKTKISSLSPVKSSIISALELNEIITSIPSQAFTHLASKYSENNELNDSELMKELDGLLEIIKFAHDKNIATIEMYPNIFPVSNILVERNQNTLDLKRPLQNWVSRILLEGAILNLKTSN